MAGQTQQTVMVLLLTSQIVRSQKYHPTTPQPYSSTPMAPDLPAVILFYLSPVITLVILVLAVFCLSQGIRRCQSKYGRARPSALPTISAGIRNGSDDDPPPPYTFRDISSDVSISTISECPPYMKEPPSYLDIISVTSEHNTDIGVPSDTTGDLRVTSDTNRELTVTSGTSGDLNVTPDNNSDQAVTSYRNSNMTVTSDFNRDLVVTSDTNGDLAVTSEAIGDMSVNTNRDLTVTSDTNRDLTVTSDTNSS